MSVTKTCRSIANDISLLVDKKGHLFDDYCRAQLQIALSYTLEVTQSVRNNPTPPSAVKKGWEGRLQNARQLFNKVNQRLGEIAKNSSKLLIIGVCTAALTWAAGKFDFKTSA